MPLLQIVVLPDVLHLLYRFELALVAHLQVLLAEGAELLVELVVQVELWPYFDAHGNNADVLEVGFYYRLVEDV